MHVESWARGVQLGAGGAGSGLGLSARHAADDVWVVPSCVYVCAQDALGLGVWWVQEFMMLNFLVPPSTWVPGTYWQLLSQFPYLGPCYPSFTPTVSYMNR